MFRILVIDKRDSIISAIKYLLYRYEIVFSRNIKDAIAILEKNIIDLILVNIPLENGEKACSELLKKWTEKKKTIVIADTVTNELIETADWFGALKCIDKLEIPSLPVFVEKYLNQAETKVLNI